MCFKKALANPFYTTPQLALYNLGLVYEKKGDPETALKQYQEAVRLQPNYGVAYYRMGQLLEELRRADEAREAYGRAIEFAPDLAEAHYRYGVMSYTAGELENAFYSLNRVVKLAPHSTMAEDARKYLERLQTVIPSGPSLRSLPPPPGERLSQLDVMTNRDLLNEQLGSGRLLRPPPRANLESLQEAKIGAGVSEPSQSLSGRMRRTSVKRTDRAPTLCNWDRSWTRRMRKICSSACGAKAMMRWSSLSATRCWASSMWFS